MGFCLLYGTELAAICHDADLHIPRMAVKPFSCNGWNEKMPGTGIGIISCWGRPADALKIHQKQ